MSLCGIGHVQDQDLRLFVLGRLKEVETVLVQSHLSECDTCHGRFEEARQFARQLADLGQELRARNEEKRREARVPVNEVACLHLVNPLVMGWSEVLVVNVSENGMMLRSSTFVQVGIVVQIRLQKRFVLAEVRHCEPVGESFHVGVQIQDSQWH